MTHQALVRSNLYHKLGGLERGGAVFHSNAPHLWQRVRLQTAAARHAGEASASRRVITSSAARVKLKRKEMGTEAQAQGDWSGPLESPGDGDGGVERPRKGPRLGRHTEGEEGRDYVCGRRGSAHKQWYSLVWRTSTLRQ
ncbi:hypothetical protein TRVL_07368 [Trypanosoma vivax]|nr:hypothetical protein TRVL_07368 [Trypanosoma vivax]